MSSVIPPTLYKKAISLTVRGQEHVYEPVANALMTSESGLGWKDRPKHSFLFLGPTGVGKSETAKCISEIIFGREQLLTLDMGGYQTENSLSAFSKTLVTSLTTMKEGVILFDEIEKGHPAITTFLLAMLDEGRFSSGENVISVASYYLIFTSNLGCKEILGFSDDSDYSTIARFAKEAAENFFRPEVVARFATVVVFNLLGQDVQRQICIGFLDQYLRQVSDQVEATYTDDVVTYLVRHGVDRRLGARPLKTCIEQKVGLALAKRQSDCGTLAVQDRNIIFQPTH